MEIDTDGLPVALRKLLVDTLWDDSEDDERRTGDCTTSIREPLQFVWITSIFAGPRSFSSIAACQ
jgi:hypothetical protein